MSRMIEVDMSIWDYNKNRIKEIKDACNVLGLEDNQEEYKLKDQDSLLISVNGIINLSCDMDEDKYKNNLKDVIWMVNHGYCNISITSTDLENIPRDETTYTKEDFLKSKTIKKDIKRYKSDSSFTHLVSIMKRRERERS